MVKSSYKILVIFPGDNGDLFQTIAPSQQLRNLKVSTDKTLVIFIRRKF